MDFHFVGVLCVYVYVHFDTVIQSDISDLF